MQEHLEEKLEQKDLSKITKIRIFKSKDSEEIIQGVILNPKEVRQLKYIKQNDSKGKDLIKGLEIKGKLELMLDKPNFEKLEKRSWENFNQDVSEGKVGVHMYELIEQNGSNFKVKI